MITAQLKSLLSRCNRACPKVGLSLLGALFLLSCGKDDSGAGLKPVYFPLTIVVAQSLGQANGVLPEDIQALCMPMIPKDCPSFLLAPDKVQIVRIDLPDAKPESLDLKKLQNDVQIGLGQQLTFKKAVSVRKDDLSKQKITLLMSQTSGPTDVIDENLNRLLAADTNLHLFTLGSAPSPMGNGVEGKGQVGANNVEELFASMSAAFCGKAGEEPKPIASLILYKVGSVSRGPIKGSTPGSISKEECDQGLDKMFRAIYADGVKTPEEQRELENLLRKCQLTANQVAQKEQEIKDRLNRSEMSLKQGMTYASQKKYGQAVTEFQHSTEIDPKNAYGWANLCEAYLSAGNQNEALTACNKAIDVDSKNWLAHYSLGLLYAKTGKKEAAINSLSEALRFVAEDQNHRITRPEVVRQIRTEPMFAPLRNDSRFQQLFNED